MNHSPLTLILSFLFLCPTHPAVGDVIQPKVVDPEDAGKPDALSLALARPVGLEGYKVDIGPNRRVCGVNLWVMIRYKSDSGRRRHKCQAGKDYAGYPTTGHA